jgi:hypothetical protein
MGGGMMVEKAKLLPEEQMQIECKVLESFLFAAEFDAVGIDHFINEMHVLRERMYDYERES